MHLPTVALCRLVRRELLLLVLILPWNRSGWTQQTAGESHTDAATLQLLLKRIDQLEARVRQLEAERALATAGSLEPPGVPANSGPSPDPPPTRTASTIPAAKPQVASKTPRPPPPDVDAAQPETAMADRMDLSKTLLRIRGFGDVALRGDTYPGDTTSFELGQLGLFITSDVSEKFKFLSEVVFEAGPDNIYGQNVNQENSFRVSMSRDT